MNLLAYIKQEVNRLNLTDALEISRFIYIKLGELFFYDAAYQTYPKESLERQKIFNKKIDIKNVTHFNLVCSTWAHLYVDLLNEFDIPCEYVEIDKHAYVRIRYNFNNINADLCYTFKDFTAIKYGYQTELFSLDTENDYLNIDKKIHYWHGMYANEVLEMIKNQLHLDQCKSLSSKINKVFTAIKVLLNTKTFNTFTCGKTYIKGLLKYFLEEDYKNIHYTSLYNRERTEFVEVFIDCSQKDLEYFAYAKNEDGIFQFDKKSKKEIDQLSEKFICQKKLTLQLDK